MGAEKTKGIPPFTKGIEKTFNYIESIIKKENFLSDIKKIRKEYKIPEEGCSLSENSLRQFKTDGFFFQPTDYCGTTYYFLKPDLNRLVNKYFKEANNLFTESILRFYFIYDILPKKEELKNSSLLDHGDLCELIDVKKEIEEEYSTNRNSPDNQAESIMSYHKLMYERIQYYPIMLMIRPEASVNDITDFIRKRLPYLKGMQKIYKKTKVLGNKRKENPKKQKRNNFIFKHKNISAKEIQFLLKEKGYGQVETSLIDKTIQQECKKRK